MSNTTLSTEALEYLQTAPSNLLSQVVKGEIDLNALAKLVLANRGQDSNGNWIGFKAASTHHQISGLNALQ